MEMINKFEKRIKNTNGLYTKLAEAIGDPKFVQCRTCKRSRPVNAAYCFKHGWPKCCGYTMTIDKLED